jgi:hypothetical protein
VAAAQGEENGEVDDGVVEGTLDCSGTAVDAGSAPTPCLCTRRLICSTIFVDMTEQEKRSKQVSMIHSLILIITDPS